jgi:hypothetical protein
MTALLPQPDISTAGRRRHAPVGQEALVVAGLVIAAVAIGVAVGVQFGEYHPLAIKWLTVGLLAGLVGTLGRGNSGGKSERVVLGLLIAGLGLQFFQIAGQSPSAGPFSLARLHRFHVGFAAAGTCLVLSLVWRRIRPVALVAMLAVYIVLGLLILSSFRSPGVDVYIFGRDAVAALLRGHNPYAVVFPDLYHSSAKSVAFYGVGASANGWLTYGYPYPPIPLLAELPGALLGDFRYAHLLAIALTGWLIATCRNDSRLAVGSAALLLFTPRGFFVLEAGWVEPVIALLLAATVWTALRHPRWLAIPLGLLLASKQYMIFAVPAVWLLLPAIPSGRRLRVGIETVATAAVCLPFAILGGKRFWQSVVVWQFHQPFRPDALSYPAWLIHSFPALAAGHSVARLAPVVAFGAATVMLLFCLWRCPRTPAGFAATVGMVLAVFFAFNKQAFCNYYYFAIASFCCAISASATT